MLNLADESLPQAVPFVAASPPGTVESGGPDVVEEVEASVSLNRAFPLLQSVVPEPDGDSGRLQQFSVTQLINYQRCPRQYYFDRVLHTPAPDALAVWNNAEAPEPPANLTATLKGAVIHKFCETYSTVDDPEERLRNSFTEIVRSRQAELADRLVEINVEEAIAELLPLAKNYLSSGVFERIERARAALLESRLVCGPRGEAGLWSELSFRLRRPRGILSGAIDKLIVTPANGGAGFIVEIIDFKTNRLRPNTSDRSPSSDLAGSAGVSPASSDAFTQGTGISENSGNVAVHKSGRDARGPSKRVEQFAFDFDASVAKPWAAVQDSSVDERVAIAARDYQLQMQAYTLAVRELVPALQGSKVISTLHFLEPNVEFQLTADLLSPETCREAIDQAMMSIASSGEPAEFPVHTAAHCRMCNFLGICNAGRSYVRSMRQTSAGVVNLKANQVGR
jgi:hypothetical protein